MPELPEVETIRGQLSPLVAGRRVTEADSHPSAKFTPATEVVGARLGIVARRGKYLLVPTDDGRELVIHLGMTGQLRPLGSSAGDDPFVRARWFLDDGTVLEYRDVRRFGRLRVVPAGEYDTIPTLAALGPEPLDESFTADDLWRALRRSRRRVKTQLLSQRPVAGIGNIYADEALWLAQVHPALRRVTRRQAGALRPALAEVVTAAIANGGTTLRDYRDVDGATGSNQHDLCCYGRGGEPCRRCGTPLTSRVYDARTTTFCPSCQAR